jgi:hypothetical protein
MLQLAFGQLQFADMAAQCSPSDCSRVEKAAGAHTHVHHCQAQGPGVTSPRLVAADARTLILSTPPNSNFFIAGVSTMSAEVAATWLHC